MKKEQPFETVGHDLVGHASLDFYNKDDFNSFASELAGYEPNRFDPVAVKIFFQEGEFIVTLYALDKSKQDQSNYPPDKLPVKKFKLRMNWEGLVKHIKHFDLIVSDGSHDIEDMLVINK